MAKLPRIFNRLFASQAGATEIGEFGSLALGTPTTTTSVSAMQSLAPWVNGWNAAVIGPNAPAIEDMNAVHRVLSYQLGYMMQAGIPEWDSQTTYYIGSLCTEVGTGTIYRSLINDNTGNALSDTASWQNVNWSFTPVGSVLAFAGSTSVIPDGYLYCDGSEVSRTTFAALFAVIGTAHGSGDGTTTFRIPDYRGRFLRGVDGSATRDPNSGARTAMNSGGNTGNAVGTVQGHAFQSHTHTYSLITNHDGLTNFDDKYPANGGDGGGFNTPSPSALTINSAGASSETRPINAYVNYIIKY